MSLTTVPVSLINFRLANNTANTLNGANVVFLGNTTFNTGVGLYQKRAGLYRGTFVDDVPAPLTNHFPGSTAGYTATGQSSAASNVIDKFPFSSNTDATDVGDVTLSRYYVTGQSSTTHGYTSGGTENGI